MIQRTKALADIDSAIRGLFRAHGQLRKVKRRSVVVPYVDPQKSLYMVSQGSLRVSLCSEGGDDVIHLCHFAPGDVFGEQGLFDNELTPLTTATMQARTDVEILAIPHQLVKRAALIDSKIYAEISSLINQRLATATTKLTQVVFSDLEQRCYDCLLDMTRLPDAMTHPDGMQISLSRIELAQMVRCTRETAGRVLKGLAEQNKISIQGQRIVINGVRHYAGSPRIMILGELVDA